MYNYIYGYNSYFTYILSNALNKRKKRRKKELFKVSGIQRREYSWKENTTIYNTF